MRGGGRRQTTMKKRFDLTLLVVALTLVSLPAFAASGARSLSSRRSLRYRQGTCGDR
jgi:hypothetical protein